MHSSNTKLYSRFIPSEEVGEVTRWKFGAVDGSEPPEPEQEPPPEEAMAPVVDEAVHLAQLQEAHDQGFAAGLAQGKEEGVAQGHQEASHEWQQRMEDYQANQAQEAAQRLASVMAALDASLTDLQKQMAHEMLHLACDLARQVVRQELRTNPAVVEPVVREALDMLVSDGRPAIVRLHPEDFAAFAEPRRAAWSAAEVQWLADPAVSPGGCLVESGGMVIDGTLEKRWQKALATLGLETPWHLPDMDVSHAD